MYFGKRARQACAKFIELKPNISLLQLKQSMYLLERQTILTTGQPLVNGTVVLTDSPQLKEVDESYLNHLSQDDGELSPRDCMNIAFIASRQDDTMQRALGNHVALYKKRFPDKSELDWTDILRAHDVPEEVVKEHEEEFEYYLRLLKQGTR